MSKEKEVKKESEKVMTKYEKKQAARMAQQKKDERSAKLTKLVFTLVCVCIVAAIVFSIGSAVIRRQNAINGTYVKIGEHEVSKVEYDFCYNTVINNYLNVYSSILPYMGLDTSKDFADQQYDESKSWKDAFDEMTVEQLKQVKALVDDSKAQGFTYDVAEDYKKFQDSLESAATEAGVSVKEYYKNNYGEYATEARLEPFEKESLLAAAYFQELLEKNKPSDEEITAYYEENKDDYDLIDYRSFTFSATIGEDAGEEEKTAAMEVVKASAEEMQAKREAGEDFEALCVQYATGDNKAVYEDAETEQSLTEGAKKSSVSYAYSDWLFSEERKEGDITVISDEASNQYHLVEFVSRSFDESSNTSISDTLSQSKTGEYVDQLSKAYDITDVAGKLKYLTIPEETVSDNGVEEGADETEELEESSSDEEAEGADSENLTE
ncbi:MAG: peptidyl-prolyl cis-trans isomerase [Lachnospiraceae bacterium]|nr:peptidyl-prolyl cis-trans isomerase [Lachnospiraceae bacterium]